MRLLILAIWLLGCQSVHAALTDVYIAQTAQGSNTGANCANAFAATFFNTVGNWGSGASQIGAGTTVHICGTWTGAANAQLLQFQGGGSTGNVVTLLFEPGAVLQAPYFKYGAGSTGGAIDLNGQSHILIDGGTTCGIVNRAAIPTNSCNGVIRNTDNGTNLTYQQNSEGIYSSGNPDDVEIRNLVISMYDRVDANDNGHAADGVNTFGIYFWHAGVTNLRVHHNNVQGAARAIMVNFEGANADTILFYNNYVADIGWGLTVGGFGANTFATNVKIYNNEVSDWTNWVSPSSAFHSNGIFTFHNCSNGETCFVGSSDSYIYNNYIHGDLNGGFSGASASGFIQTSSASQFTVFNNYIVGSASAGAFGIGNGLYALGCATKTPTVCGGGLKYYNNTIDYLGANGNCIAVETVSSNTIQNNIFMNGCNGIVTPYQDGYAIVSSNYNVGYSLRGGSNWACSTVFPCKTLATFQSLGKDLNSVNTNPLLTSEGRLGVGSSAIGIGTNLTSLGIAELNLDAAGNPRPTSGAWDIGAFQYDNGFRFSPSFNLRRVSWEEE